MITENLPAEKILARLATEDFIGRAAELEHLHRHARGETGSPALLLLAAPGAGASELLRQTYDRLFEEHGETIPFYFAINQTDRTARDMARRFLREFAAQIVAFRRIEADVISASPEIYELVELSAAYADVQWLKRLATAYQREEKIDERAFIRNCLSAPLRAAAYGTRILVMIDDFQNAENIAGNINLVEELKEIYSLAGDGGGVRFVFAGRRRYVLKAAQTGETKLPNPEVLRLDVFPAETAARLIENLSAKYGVAIGEQSRDLIVRQFGGNPLLIESMFIAASARQIDLDSFQKVQRIYVDELFGGGIGKFYDTEFQEIVSRFKTQTELIRLLSDILKDEQRRAETESWGRELGLSETDLARLARGLHTREIINLNANLIEISDENLPLVDYIQARYRQEIQNEPRALVVGDHLAKSLERASHLMARFYRRASSIGLRELLSAFNCQEIPLALIDYAKFKVDYKGLPEDEIARNLKRESEKILLPQIVYTAHGAAFYAPLKQLADEERCAVGLAFQAADYRHENEIAWLVAEIDSKMEAEAALAEFWCDRLEMVALACNFLKYQMWLVAPEGFAPEAMEVLRQRNAFGSSRRQIKLLSKHLNAGNVLKEQRKSNEYEMVLPMGDDTELIAAGAVEEIARRHDFQPKAITQIKTALVEACINATEHSHSPDRKIYQKFTVEDDKIVITISNRGVRIPSTKVAEMTAQIDPDDGRRGWGLKLMRTLMDEVKFEQVDDGTRISMVKYMKR